MNCVKFGFVLGLTALGIVGSANAQIVVPAGCVAPHPTAAHSFYVDPATGNINNDGSKAHPWDTLANVVAKGKISSQHFVTPYAPASALVPQNPNGAVHPGDTIFLESGDHGDVSIYGYVNSDFIAVEADKGAKPILRTLKVGGSSKWLFRGLSVESATGLHELVLFAFGFWGPAENIVFVGNHVMAQPDVSAWQGADWVAKAPFIGIYDNKASCVTVAGNEIRNIRNGMQIFGPNSLIANNTIDNWGDDAIDHGGNNVTIEGNRITNNHYIGDSNHNDCIQGWTVPVDATNTNVLIQNNLCIATADPHLWSPDYAQGISYFDGKWVKYRVINNVVISYSGQGIAVAGGDDIQIINNTVLTTPPPESLDPYIYTDASRSKRLTLQPQYSIGSRKPAQGGNPPTNVIVRNNIGVHFNFQATGPTIQADHNITITDPESVFKKFDPVNRVYDVSLKPGSPAIGAGEKTFAPTTDITGKPRHAVIDAGAYQVSP